MRTVSELAALAGVTVRTLHHYDRIGLLTPSARSESGYRLYDHADLLRLQQIMVWRELGFGLAEIGPLLDDPGYDLAGALESQRAELEGRVDELQLVLKRVEEALAEVRGGPPVEEETMYEGFSHEQYAAEAEERWGGTPEWEQSQARWRALDDAGKRRVVEEAERFAAHLAEVFTSGVPADSEQAMDLAEQARLQIDQMAYDCDHGRHMCLGDMYVQDERFTRYYDRHAEGTAAWLRDAIYANGARNGVVEAGW